MQTLTEPERDALSHQCPAWRVLPDRDAALAAAIDQAVTP